MPDKYYKYRNNVTMVIYYTKRVGFPIFKDTLKFLIDDGVYSGKDLEVIKDALEKAKRDDT